MENKITIDVPKGYIAKKEKTENGVNIVFVTKKDDEKEAWFKSIFNKLTMVIDYSGKFPNSIFFTKDDIVLFELCKSEDNTKTYFYTNYEKIWAIFYDKYSMGDEDIQRFIKKQVKKHLNIKKVTPIGANLYTPSEI